MVRHSSTLVMRLEGFCNWLVFSLLNFTKMMRVNTRHSPAMAIMKKVILLLIFNPVLRSPKY